MTSVGRLQHVLHLRSVRLGALLVAIAVAWFNAKRLPSLSVLPVVLGLLPWVVGKYVLCPLRWHAISAGGQTRRWHLRVYAESELLGMLSPAHSGADLWRAHKLAEQQERRAVRPVKVVDHQQQRRPGGQPVVTARP